MSGFDPYEIRKDFPILSRKNRGKPLVYLDNAATSQKPQVVIDSIRSFYESTNSNVHRGVYELAEEAESLYVHSRKKIAHWIGAEVGEIVYTRGATEGINLIARSFGESLLKKGDVILLSEMEHHANLVPWQMLAQSVGAEIQVIPIMEDGSLDLSRLWEMLADDKSRILSLCHVSNVLGTVNPIRQIVDEAHANDVKVVVDAAQSVPHLRIDVRDLGCDFLVFSGHKVFAPMGIGVTFVKSDLLERMKPYQGGGDMIDQVSFSGTTFANGAQRLEAGTPNVCGAIALGEAIGYLEKISFEGAYEHEKTLLEHTRSELADIPGLREHGTTPNKAGVFCFSIDGVHPHDLSTLLDAEGIATRTGHHCCQPLMKRLGLEATARASFSIYNTQEEASLFANAIRRAVRILV